VNVGGKNRIPMAGLKSALTSLGLEDVVTYVQSGNVVFACPAAAGDALARSIEKQIAGAFGLEITVVIRTRAELARIVDANPFSLDDVEPAKLHVMFLDAHPSAKAIAGLDPALSPPDEFAVHGSEIYVHYPGGSGRSRLTVGYVERRLGVRATARNWNTVRKLLELAEQ
jgi:uncharacterized protein (DUF1697 family)